MGLWEHGLFLLRKIDPFLFFAIFTTTIMETIYKNKEDDIMVMIGLIVIMVGVVIVAMGSNNK